jgi:hypothetical protein
MLGHVDFGNSCFGGFFFIHLLSMQKQYHVGIKLNGAGFPKIRQLWPFVRPVFQFAVETGDGQNRYM